MNGYKKVPLLINIGSKLLFAGTIALSLLVIRLLNNVGGLKAIWQAIGNVSNHTASLVPYMFFTLILLVIFLFLMLGIHILKQLFKIPTENTDLLDEEKEKKANNMSNLIFSAAFTYLLQQYKYIIMIGGVVFSFLIYNNYYIGSGFFFGALLSCIASFFSMYVCVTTNIRTAIEANRSLKDAFNTAFMAGLSGSIFTNGICLLCPLLIMVFITFFNLSNTIISDICFGTSFGCSFIWRIAGGIFTKAADVGADLVGKIEAELAEDDARNPAVIADNVGDNVGDCNGMIADVFESYVVTLLMAILWVPESTKFGGLSYFNWYLYASYFVLCGGGLINTFLCKYIINFTNNVWNKLQVYFYANVVLNFLIGAVWFLGTYKVFQIPSSIAYNMIYCTIIGFAVSIGILKSTEYYTSSKYSPVRNLAAAASSGHGTNIIYGLSISFLCVGAPLFIIIAGILTSYVLLGFVGVIITAISMISITGSIITLDLIGPITDNAGGIAEVSEMDSSVRDITDHLDSVGNITKAITKGFSIGSAALTAVITNMLFINEVLLLKDVDVVCSITQPVIFCGIFIGGIVTYLFCGLGLRAVGEAAQSIVEDVREQLRLYPGILTREVAPDYKRTISFLTKTSIRKMILPALLPIIIPILSFFSYKYIFGMYLIYDFLAAISLGTTFTAIFLSINMTTAGGAWDNSKKYIEEGHLGGKKSFAHMCAITGDTVGDPYKDTVGPALNALSKLVPIVSYLIVKFC
jgi:K(+)-stimulated pyrophosphate-energized sodium pump